MGVSQMGVSTLIVRVPRRPRRRWGTRCRGSVVIFPGVGIKLTKWKCLSVLVTRLVTLRRLSRQRTQLLVVRLSVWRTGFKWRRRHRSDQSCRNCVMLMDPVPASGPTSFLTVP